MDIEKWFSNLPELIVHDGTLYYDPSVNKCFQVRGTHDDYAICSNPTTYVSDATTHKTTQRLSWGYLEGCVELVQGYDAYSSILENDGIGWRTRARRKE